MIVVGSNVISQIINRITKKIDFSMMSVFNTVVNFTIDYIIGELLNIKAPKTIRDIKEKAQQLGIKGARKLTKFLNKQIFKFNLATITVSNIKSIIQTISKNTFNSLFGKKGKMLA